MTRSLNKVILIGNLTRDPEIRYTPQGVARAVFGLATNRTWTTESGEKKDEVEFHNIVVWNKLAELVSQYLVKGRRVYLEGRLQTRKWTDQANEEKKITEIVVSDILFLDPKGTPTEDVATSSTDASSTEQVADTFDPDEVDKPRTKKSKPKTKKSKEPDDDDDDDDIPF